MFFIGISNRVAYYMPNISGDRWRTRRRLLTPAFHFQILESFFDVFNERSKSLITDLTEASKEAALRVGGGSTPSASAPINVYTILTQCALDIICGKQ